MLVLMLIPFFLFAALNYIPVFFTHKKFGYSITATMIGSALVMYFGQLLFHSYRYPFFLIIGLSLFGAVLFCVSVWKRRDKIKDFFSTGFWVFLTVFIAYLVIDYNRNFSTFDEFYHWGTMVKESLRLNDFYSVPESNLWIHKDYPPFSTMLELLWCKLCRGYSEAAVSMAMHIFCMTAILCAVLENVTEKIKKNPLWKMLYTLIFTISVLMLMLFIDPWGDRVTTSILVDVLLPVLFAHSMFFIYTRDAFDSKLGFLNVILSCSAMLMTKQAGIFFVLITTIYYILKAIFVKNISGGRRVVNIIKAFCPVIIACLILQTWRSYISRWDIKGQFMVESVSGRDYLNVFTGKTEGLVNDTLHRFFEALFSCPITSVDWLPLSYFAAFILFTVILIILRIAFKKHFLRGEAFILGITLTVGHLGYACMMAVMYAYFFNNEEMKILASYERYMASYVLGEVLLLLMVFLICLSRVRKVSLSIPKICVVAACAIAAFNPMNTVFIMPQGLREDVNARYKPDAKFLSEKTVAGDSVFVVYDSSKVYPSWWGAYQVYLQYYLNDRYISREKVGAYSLDFKTAEEKESLTKAIIKNDYLYLKATNSHINDVYKEYFGTDKPQEEAIYKVVTNSDGTTLEALEIIR